MNIAKEIFKLGIEILGRVSGLEEPLTVELERTHDDRDAYEIIRKRVVHRFIDKCKDMGVDKKEYKRYAFKDLFALPEGVSFDLWLFIQLRGRSVDDLFILNLDHIVPLSIADNFEELLILMSWKNTRLSDAKMNEEKSSHFDAENTLLLKRLLNKEVPDHWDGLTGRVVKEANLHKERLNKLLSRKGKKKEKI